jgi:hypothetical protein
MVTIDINGQRKSLAEKHESWVTEQINNRRKSGIPVTIRIEIGGDINLNFSADDQPCGGGGGSRNYSRTQQEVINLWCNSKLNSPPVAPGDLISFLKRLSKLL